MVDFYLITIVSVTLLIHFILFILGRYDKKKKQEQLMIENAAIILDKIDNLKLRGGKKMDEDLKKLAKYFAKKIEETNNKIDEAKEEIIDEINTRFEEFGEGETPEEEIIDDFEPEATDEIEEESQPEKPVPESLDVKKRQQTTQQATNEEDPKKKRGLFGKKK